MYKNWNKKNGFDQPNKFWLRKVTPQVKQQAWTEHKIKVREIEVQKFEKEWDE